jgi:drug/metabolite transporter (DMT)-like permease
MKRRDLFDYVLLSIIWGFSFLVVLRTVAAFGWIGAVAFRCFIAAATLFAAATLTRRKLDFGAGWRPFAVIGASTVAIQLVGISYATPRIGTAMAAIFIAAIPLFSLVIGQLLGIERITARGSAGLLLGLAGMVMLVGFPAVPVTASFVGGCAASLLSALAAAFGSNYASRHLRTVGPWEVTIGSFLCGGAMTLPLLLAVPVPAMPRPVDFAYLVLAGCVMSALTYSLYFRLVASIGPTKAISVEFIVTVIAVLVGAFLLGERLSALQIAGALVIVLGCALVLGLIPRARLSMS